MRAAPVLARIHYRCRRRPHGAARLPLPLRRVACRLLRPEPSWAPAPLAWRRSRGVCGEAVSRAGGDPRRCGGGGVAMLTARLDLCRAGPRAASDARRRRGAMSAAVVDATVNVRLKTFKPPCPAGAPCRRPWSTRASTPSAATTAGPPPIHPHPPPRPARRCAPLGARGPAVGAGGGWSRRGAQGAVGVDWGRERRGGGEAADLEACPTRAVVPSLRQPLPQRSALVTCRVPA